MFSVTMCLLLAGWNIFNGSEAEGDRRYYIRKNSLICRLGDLLWTKNTRLWQDEEESRWYVCLGLF